MVGRKGLSSYNKRDRKLESYQVILIRQMRREGFRRKFISKLFGVSENSIYRIMDRSTYKDIK